MIHQVFCAYLYWYSELFKFFFFNFKWAFTILALHTDAIHNFILTAGEGCKNTEILSIKLLLRKTSGEVCKNNPIEIQSVFTWSYFKVDGMALAKLVLMRNEIVVGWTLSLSLYLFEGKWRFDWFC